MKLSCLKKIQRIMKRKKNLWIEGRERGAGMVEILISVAILSLILTSLYSLFIGQYRSFEAQRDIATTQRDIRASLSLLERDVRMAGFGVPRGTNPIAAVADGTGSNPSAPDSISINFSIGPLAYLVSNTVEFPGSQNIISVNSASSFNVGDTVNLINNDNNNLLGTYTVTDVDVLNNKLSLDTDPSSSGMEVGDLIVRNFKTVTYSVVQNPVTGRNELVRNDGTVQSVIIDGIVDFQLSYILDDGTEVTAPADLSDIRRVRLDLVAETVREVAQLGGNQIPRELRTIIPVKNVRL